MNPPIKFADLQARVPPYLSGCVLLLAPEWDDWDADPAEHEDEAFRAVRELCLTHRWHSRIEINDPNCTTLVQIWDWHATPLVALVVVHEPGHARDENEVAIVLCMALLDAHAEWTRLGYP